ncbi:MAG: YeeE/YedE family protein [Desulfobulbaceae bacterium]|nr:MAG: YeeE/YedE family protein [Desulfobulbaceae bacterium]
MTLIMGLVTGMIFGALLQQAQVLRFEKQVGAMRLIDMTIVKFMLSAIIVGSIGIHLLADLGMVSFAPRGLSFGLQVVGGLLFGIGWAFLGYCPGTSIGALAEGRYHVIWPILGMLLGGVVFVFLYPWIQAHLRPLGDFGALSVSNLLGVSHWLVIAAIAVGAFFLFRFFEKKGL